jgi:molecular chaperone DnaJ
MGGAASGGMNMDDIFSHFGDIIGDLFTGGRGGFSGNFQGFSGFSGSGRAKKRVRQGTNIRIKVKLTLEEIAVNCEKKLKIQKYIACDKCGGTGAKTKDGVSACPTCKGSGQEVRQERTMFGLFQQTVVCHACNGSGEVIKTPCPHCHGHGIVKGDEIVSVNIPAGVAEGMQFNMHGKGNAAPNGGINGDLIVVIEEIDHDTFEREGNNLYLNYYISFPQAALGANVEIPTLNGKARVKIAAGTQGGQILRLQGKGVPELHTSRMGDLIVNVNVWTPKNLSKEEKAIIEKFNTSENFIPKPDKNEKGFFNRVRQFFN